jgi:hypothetical protein
MLPQLAGHLILRTAGREAAGEGINELHRAQEVLERERMKMLSSYHDSVCPDAHNGEDLRHV